MTLKCPTCEREFTHQGGFNLHKYHCKFKSMENVPRETIPVKKECEHQWRFLDSRSSDENKAIQHGYSEVCITCQNLRV